MYYDCVIYYTIQEGMALPYPFSFIMKVNVCAANTIKFEIGTSYSRRGLVGSILAY